MRFLGLCTALLVGCGSSSSSPPPGHGDAGSHRDAASPDTGAAEHDAARKAPGDAGATNDADSAGDGSASGDAGVLAARPYTLHVPVGYDPAKATPLVVMFHGYSASGPIEELYFQLTATSDANNFLYAYGNGLFNPLGDRYWNADNACCDFYNVPVDDVAYFDAIVADVESKYMVDKKRIFVVGHSNGGFMSHRLACDRSSTVAAIVSLAGAVWEDASQCNPTDKVSIAEVHGDADMTIFYDGGSTPEGTYPAATTTVATWAAKNGCGTPIAPTGTTLTLDTTLPANQTVVSGFPSCPAGIDVELWTIHGGGHIPTLPYPGWGDAVWGFLSAHAKP